jgi:hypothetical protein
MREAKLVGLSQDGKNLILAMAETGEEFAVPVDDRMRAALRGDRARLAQLEITMESALRPRDIQARIRAGESPEAVATVAQMPIEKVMAFAGPVLAERDHIATLAQRASVRRRGGDGATRTLGAWVTERLRGRDVDPNSAEWDAWRRDDGKWAVRVSYHHGETERVALFAYDAPGRFAVPNDDEARWLVGEQTEITQPHPAASPGRRLTAVSNPFVDVAPDHVADSYQAGLEADVDNSRATAWGSRRVRPVQNPDEEPTLVNVGPTEPPAAVRPIVRTVEPAQEPPVPADDHPRPPPTRPAAVPAEPPAPHAPRTVERERARREPVEELPLDDAPPAPAAQPEPEGAAAPAAEETADSHPKKKAARSGSKRASVPSWDEIMFGKKAD